MVGWKRAWMQVSCALLTLAWAPSAQALPLVSLDLDATAPGIQAHRAVAAGERFDALVVIEGVEPGEGLVGFELQVDFAATALAPLAAAAGLFLLPAVLEIPSLGSGSVALTAVSQATGVATGAGVLAELRFEALAAGSTPVDFVRLVLSAPLGVPVSHRQAGARVVVPEPPLLLLLLAVLWRTPALRPRA